VIEVRQVCLTALFRSVSTVAVSRPGGLCMLGLHAMHIHDAYLPDLDFSMWSWSLSIY